MAQSRWFDPGPYLGRQIPFTLHLPAQLPSLSYLLQTVTDRSGCTVVESISHQSPRASQVIKVISESHLAVYELQGVNILVGDFFTCGDTDPYMVLQVMVDALYEIFQEFIGVQIEGFEIRGKKVILDAEVLAEQTA